jgi:hypothetical protein
LRAHILGSAHGIIRGMYGSHPMASILEQHAQRLCGIGVVIHNQDALPHASWFRRRLVGDRKPLIINHGFRQEYTELAPAARALAPRLDRTAVQFH